MCIYDDYLVASDLVLMAEQRISDLKHELESALKVFPILQELTAALQDHRLASQRLNELSQLLSPEQRRELHLS